VTGPIPVEVLDGLDDGACAAALAPLFEGAPRFLARLVAARPFGDVAGLFARARAVAHAMPEIEQLELIDAHPRLGAAPDSVSPMSFVEQGYDLNVAEIAAAAQHARLAEELKRLNAAYEARFGFRYCVFVDGRSREALVPEMEASLAAERATEIVRAIDAVVDVAADRYSRLGG
jgi:2-oxo-4-hydroxy-4-carboxy--5-ureidoimidazoline (OHCU) decarboxylase